MCSVTACKDCWPSSRLMVIVNGLNPPAWMLVVPAVNDGENGKLGSGQGDPFGPLVTSNVEEAFTLSAPDHGAYVALVLYAPHRAGLASGARSPPKKCS